MRKLPDTGSVNAVHATASTLRHWVIAAGIALIVLIVATGSYEAWQDYRSTLRDNERSQQALGRVLSEQTARMVQEVDVVLSDYGSWVMSAAGRAATEEGKRERLRSEIARLPFVYSAALAGVDGRVLSTDQSASIASSSLADPQSVNVPAPALNDALYIGKPFIDIRDGARTFALSRRIDDASGAFAGVVVARIAFEYLTGFYAGVSSTPDMSIRLLRSDGVVLAQYPTGAGPIPDDRYVQREYSGATQTKEEVRYLQSPGPPEVSTLRNVEGYPIVVAIARPLSGVLHSWKAEQIASAARTLVLAALAGSLLLALRSALLKYDRVEQERHRIARELENAQRSEALGFLAASIAHDFNNVLTSIVGYGELARKSTADGTSESGNLDRLLLAAERARVLVRRVLTFNPRRSLNYVPLSIEPIVAEVVSQVEATLSPAITVHVHGPGKPATLLGDATEVHQVVMNLCSNAVKAMPDGGTLEIRLEVVEQHEARALTLGRLLPGAWISLAIIDTGVGLAEQQIESMFEPFYTTRQPGQGAGIGLTVVRNIISGMHAALAVESHLGSGTRITVFWPLIAQLIDRRTASPADSQSELPQLGRGETVMVVDDEPELVLLAEEVLASLGYEPVGFTVARAALGAFRRNPERFDAVLTDERMQSLRGCDLATLIHKINPNVPILLMTGYRDADVDQLATEAGIADILDKPLRAETLRAALKRYLAAPRFN